MVAESLSTIIDSRCAPILLNRNNLVIYTLAWISETTIQAGVLDLYSGLEIRPAQTDSIVFNTIFFLVGAAYLLKYLTYSTLLSPSS